MQVAQAAFAVQGYAIAIGILNIPASHWGPDGTTVRMQTTAQHCYRLLAARLLNASALHVDWIVWLR